MATTELITCQNNTELNKLIDNKDFTIAKIIVNTILNNINTKKKRIHILSIKLIEESTILDLTLDKKYFVETLNENIKYYLDRELYEECAKILNAIKQLSE